MKGVFAEFAGQISSYSIRYSWFHTPLKCTNWTDWTGIAAGRDGGSGNRTSSIHPCHSTVQVNILSIVIGNVIVVSFQ